MNNYVRTILVVAVFSLVAFLGGLIKFGGAASIALDSWASFFVAAFFGPVAGGLVGLFGHLLSATSGGFPFGPWVHVVVMILQFIWAYLFGYIARKMDTLYGLVGAGVIAVVGNGIIAPYLIGLIFPHLADVMMTLVPVLLLASVANVVLAIVVLFGVRRLRKTQA